MKKIIYYFAIVITSFSLFSCEDVVNTDLQTAPPKLVIDANIKWEKGTLGNEHDMLVDDRPHKAHCEHFLGTFIHFGSDTFPSWDAVVAYLEQHPEWKNAARAPAGR